MQANILAHAGTYEKHMDVSTRRMLFLVQAPSSLNFLMSLMTSFLGASEVDKMDSLPGHSCKVMHTARSVAM